MEILPWSSGHRAFREDFRGFLAREVIPFVDRWEADGIVPRSAWRAVGAAGFLCTDVPREYGGRGLDFLYSVIVVDEMAKTNCYGLSPRLHSNVVVPYITSFASEELKHRYLPGCIAGEIVTGIAMTEPHAGSDVAAIRTSAVEDGDVVVLNGQKTFISNGTNGDLFVVAARDPATEDPHRAVDIYLVEGKTPGFERGRRLKKAGWHSQDTTEIFFNDCRVPLSHRLGGKGSGFKNLMRHLQPERLVVAIGAVSAAEWVLEHTISHVKGTDVSGRALSSFQSVRFEIAEMATEVQISRTFVDKLIADHIEGMNVVREVSMAKWWTTETAWRIADRCLQLHGRLGLDESGPLARAWRDLRVTRILAGTNEIMKGIIARMTGV